MLLVKAPNIELTFPSKWEEVTLAQFLVLHQAMSLKGQEVAAFTIRDALESMVSDLGQLHQLGAAEQAGIINHLPFLGNLPDFESMPPPRTTAGICPPDELGACTLLQKWSVEELIDERRASGMDVDFVSIAVPVLSIFLYPTLTGLPLTATGQIDQIKERIWHLPCTEALPLSAFFLGNYRKSTNTGRASFVISFPETPMRKSLKAWFLSWTRTMTTQFFARSPRSGV